MLASHIAPQEEEEESAQREECSSEKEARRSMFREHLRARPTPHEMGLRLVCVKKPVVTRPLQSDNPQRLQMGKGTGDFFKRKRWKMFISRDFFTIIISLSLFSFIQSKNILVF